MNREFNNQNHTYPIVLIPPRINTYLINGISIGQKELDEILPKPNEPNTFKAKKPSRIIWKYNNVSKIHWPEFLKMIIRAPFIAIIPAAVAAIFLGPFLNDFRISFLIPLVIITIVIVFLGYIGSVEEMEEKEQVELTDDEYNQQFTDYEKLEALYAVRNKKIIKKYEESLKEYQVSLKTLRSKLIKSRMVEIFKSDTGISRNKFPPKRGRTELKFLKQLKNEKFAANLYADMQSDIANYTPDFTLLIDEFNLHLDLEIDEPYSLPDRNPVHFVGSEDDKRNEFFLGINWIVIRFTEKQVVIQPEECIKTIKSIVKSVLLGDKQFSCYVQLENRPTYEESLILAEERFREGYL